MHIRPIDRRYGVDLRFGLTERAVGEGAHRSAFRENSETKGEIAMVL